MAQTTQPGPSSEQMTLDYAASLRLSQARNSPMQSGATLAVQPPRKAPNLRQRIGLWIAGADGGQVVFAPQQPLQPTAQYPEAQVIGRPWDFPVGWNTRVTPRSDTISFGTLKALANGYDVLRILIERVKDKVCASQWSIQPIAKEQKRDTRCDDMQAFFQFPDKQNSFQDWLRALLDQVIVLDAPAIYLRPDRGGRLYSCEVLDGAMIQPKIMADGRIPPPEAGPAYQQVIKSGLPAVDYIQPVPIGQPVPTGPDGWPLPELLYKPRNKRVDSPYGFGPVEQMITTINIALARESYLLSYYTHGSTPDMVWSCPPTWTTKQIADFKSWWDSVLSGNIGERRGSMFVPDGTKPFDMKEKALTDETDQWLIRIMCFSLGLNPMPFIKQMNKGQEKTHHDEAQSEGLQPWLEWVSDLIGYIMRVKFGYADLRLHWEEDEAIDPLEAAQIDQILVNAKIYHPDELRARRGDDAMTDDLRGQMDMATFNAAPNATVLPEDQQAAQNEHAIALAAARPAPVVGAPGDKPPPEKSAAEKMHEIELAKHGAPVVNVAAPNISTPVNVAPAAIHVDAPAIHVDAPEIHLGDSFIDVGATNVKVDMPRAPGVRKVVHAEQLPDGSFRGVLRDADSVKVSSAKDANGKTIAKVEE